MRTVEWIILIYCAYLGVLAGVRVPAPARRRRAWLLIATMAGAVLAAARLPPPAGAAVVRDWLPAACILLAYWASGAFFISPMLGWEQRLAAIDRRLLRHLPRSDALDGVLELAYLSVYLVIPAGFATVYLSARGVDIDRYWTIVVLSELGCYAMLPWIQTRPPRALVTGAVGSEQSQWRRVNLAVLARGSIQANTFPSGHTAGAVATALAVMGSWPAAGAFFLIWAMLIAAGSVAGRYHYAADAILGAAWAIVAWVAVET